MYVCVCVYVCVCTYVCMYVGMNVCTYVICMYKADRCNTPGLLKFSAGLYIQIFTLSIIGTMYYTVTKAHFN